MIHKEWNQKWGQKEGRATEQKYGEGRKKNINDEKYKNIKNIKDEKEEFFSQPHP